MSKLGKLLSQRKSTNVDDRRDDPPYALKERLAAQRPIIMDAVDQFHHGTSDQQKGAVQRMKNLSRTRLRNTNLHQKFGKP